MSTNGCFSRGVSFEPPRFRAPRGHVFLYHVPSHRISRNCFSDRGHGSLLRVDSLIREENLFGPDTLGTLVHHFWADRFDQEPTQLQDSRKLYSAEKFEALKSFTLNPCPPPEMEARHSHKIPARPSQSVRWSHPPAVRGGGRERYRWLVVTRTYPH